MESGHHLGVIKGKWNSQRCYNKNFREICGRPMIHWTLDVAKKAGVFHQIIVSTVEQGAEEVHAVIRDYDPNIAVITRDGNARNQVESNAHDYVSSLFPDYLFCTGLFATSCFIRPSWIRAADKILREVRRGGARFDYPISHVVAYPRPVDMVQSWCLAPIQFPSDFYLEHRGVTLDIDTESEFAYAEKVMSALLETDYFDKEDIHLEDNVYRKALLWNRI